MKTPREPKKCAHCELSFLRYKELAFHVRHTHIKIEKFVCGTHYHYSNEARLICTGEYKQYINALKEKIDNIPQ